MSRTILIMAGGTGGHVFPALAVADELRARGWRVVWLGTKQGLEAKLVPARGYAMEWISFSGVRGKGWLRFLLLPLQLIIACAQSVRVMLRQRPDVVLGMGGYATFPGGLMSSLLNRPLAIHEQNSVAGLSNRVLALLADRVMTGFPSAFAAPMRSPIGRALPRVGNVQWSGNPVRADIAALPAPQERYRQRRDNLSLLIVGGSQGARALNEALPRALALLPADKRPRVCHQAGAQHYEDLTAAYAEAGVDAEIKPFLDDMAQRYANCDLIVCRAGALTVAELAAAGVASILVPYPYAVDDHQSGNARFLSERGAAVLLPQGELTPQRLAALIAGFTREQLSEMAQKARALAKPEAARSVAQSCMELAHAA